MISWILWKLGIVDRWVLVKNLGKDDVCWITITCSDHLIPVDAMVAEMIVNGYKLVSGKQPTLLNSEVKDNGKD